MVKKRKTLEIIDRDVQIVNLYLETHNCAEVARRMDIPHTRVRDALSKFRRRINFRNRAGGSINPDMASDYHLTLYPEYVRKALANLTKEDKQEHLK